MTVYRSHPFDLILSMIFATVMLGFTTGIWIYLFGNQVSHLSIYGVDWEIFLFYLTGANLRHSHIWLNYPYKVSYMLMSTAQHHIHHSVEPKHYDKNFGYSVRCFKLTPEIIKREEITKNILKEMNSVMTRMDNFFKQNHDTVMKSTLAKRFYYIMDNKMKKSVPFEKMVPIMKWSLNKLNESKK
jgi:hypothetical protein